jgi:hypothetical protein
MLEEFSCLKQGSQFLIQESRFPVLELGNIRNLLKLECGTHLHPVVQNLDK